MPTLLGQVTAFVLNLRNLPSQATLARDSNFIAGVRCRWTMRLICKFGESSTEFTVFKVKYGFLTVGHVLGEEVVEVVRSQRVGDPSSIA